MRIRSPSQAANCEETLQKGLRPTRLLRSRLESRHALRDESKNGCEEDLRPTRALPNPLPHTNTQLHF